MVASCICQGTFQFTREYNVIRFLHWHMSDMSQISTFSVTSNISQDGYPSLFSVPAVHVLKLFGDHDLNPTYLSLLMFARIQILLFSFYVYFINILLLVVLLRL